jgi:DNA repair exonuclease SbcCD ATPase subunit
VLDAHVPLAGIGDSGYLLAPPGSSSGKEERSVNERRNATENGQARSETAAVAEEVLRNSVPAPLAAKQEEGPSAFWKIFGGTLLSIAALVAITLCQHFNARLNALQADASYQNTDLRKDLSRLSEAQAELLKKDEFNNRLKSVWDNLKDVRDIAALLAGLKERAGAAEQQLRVAEAERKELLREVQLLREQRVAEQERRELLRELQALRERLAVLEGRKPERPGVAVDE